VSALGARVRSLVADGFRSGRLRGVRGSIGARWRGWRRVVSGRPHRRPAAGSKLDPFEPLLRRRLGAWPQLRALRATEILRGYGYEGSVDLGSAGAADRVSAGQVLQLDRAEMPSQRGCWGGSGACTRWSRAAALGCAERVLQPRDDAGVVSGGTRARVRVVRRGAALVLLRQPALGRCPPRAGAGGSGISAFRICAATTPFTQPRARRRARARRARSNRRCVTSRTASAGAPLPLAHRARRRVRGLARPRRQRVPPRQRPLPGRGTAGGGASCAAAVGSLRFDWAGSRSARVPLDGYLRHSRCSYRAPVRLVQARVEVRFERDQVWIVHRGSEGGCPTSCVSRSG
jgi:hypothetical protein